MNIKYTILLIGLLVSVYNVIGQTCPPWMRPSDASDVEKFDLSSPSMTNEWCNGLFYYDGNPDCQSMEIDWEVEFTSLGEGDWQYVIEICRIEFENIYHPEYYELVKRTNIQTGPKSWDYVTHTVTTPVQKNYTYKAIVHQRKKHLGLWLGWRKNSTQTVNIVECNYNCVNDRDIVEPFYSGDEYYVRAANDITATNVINTGADIKYYAGNSVKLNTGFHAQKGALFKADIEACTVSKSTENYTDNQLLENKSPDSNIQIFPNPTNGIIHLTISDVNTPVNVTVVDFTGKTVLNRILHEPTADLDLSEFGKGIFIIIVQSSELNVTRKIVVY